MFSKLEGITKEEALKNMKNNKSPGPYGAHTEYYTVFFLERHWKLSYQITLPWISKRRTFINSETRCNKYNSKER